MNYPGKLKIGVLGGGQLGRMLFQESVNLGFEMHFMDPDAKAPCSELGASFRVGDLENPVDVIEFGKSMDVVTIEIEKVSVEGLKELKGKGVKVFPDPDLIGIIQDKVTQKQFFKDHGFPTAPFRVIEGADDALGLDLELPIVNKIGRGGYDGRGVSIVKEAKRENFFDAQGLLEDLADIDKEIAVIVARNSKGEIQSFPAVEMVFDPKANLVDYLVAPASIQSEKEEEARSISENLARELELVGIMAVELFLNNDGSIWVNELAPRPHNSGHQTIEGNITSQYGQHLRAITGLPLGDTSLRQPSAMVNILGEEGYTGTPVYQGL